MGIRIQNAPARIYNQAKYDYQKYKKDDLVKKYQKKLYAFTTSQINILIHAIETIQHKLNNATLTQDIIDSLISRLKFEGLREPKEIMNDFLCLAVHNPLKSIWFGEKKLNYFGYTNYTNRLEQVLKLFKAQRKLPNEKEKSEKVPTASVLENSLFYSSSEIPKGQDDNTFFYRCSNQKFGHGFYDLEASKKPVYCYHTVDLSDEEKNHLLSDVTELYHLKYIDKIVYFRYALYFQNKDFIDTLLKEKNPNESVQCFIKECLDLMSETYPFFSRKREDRDLSTYYYVEINRRHKYDNGWDRWIAWEKNKSSQVKEFNLEILKLLLEAEFSNIDNIEEKSFLEIVESILSIAVSGSNDVTSICERLLEDCRKALTIFSSLLNSLENPYTKKEIWNFIFRHCYKNSVNLKIKKHEKNSLYDKRLNRLGQNIFIIYHSENYSLFNIFNLEVIKLCIENGVEFDSNENKENYIKHMFFIAIELENESFIKEIINNIYFFIDNKDDQFRTYYEFYRNWISVFPNNLNNDYKNQFEKSVFSSIINELFEKCFYLQEDLSFKIECMKSFFSISMEADKQYFSPLPNNTDSTRSYFITQALFEKVDLIFLKEFMNYYVHNCPNLDESMAFFLAKSCFRPRNVVPLKDYTQSLLIILLFCFENHGNKTKIILLIKETGKLTVENLSNFLKSLISDYEFFKDLKDNFLSIFEYFLKEILQTLDLKEIELFLDNVYIIIARMVVFRVRKNLLSLNGQQNIYAQSKNETILNLLFAVQKILFSYQKTLKLNYTQSYFQNQITNKNLVSQNRNHNQSKEFEAINNSATVKTLLSSKNLSITNLQGFSDFLPLIMKHLDYKDIVNLYSAFRFDKSTYKGITSTLELEIKRQRTLARSCAKHLIQNERNPDRIFELFKDKTNHTLRRADADEEFFPRHVKAYLQLALTFNVSLMEGSVSDDYIGTNHTNMYDRSFFHFIPNMILLGKTVNALYFFCSVGDVEYVSLLIKHKVDVNYKTTNGLTPLHFACYFGHLEIVKLLVENKAEIYVETGIVPTPCELALKNGHDEIVSFLGSQVLTSNAM